MTFIDFRWLTAGIRTNKNDSLQTNLRFSFSYQVPLRYWRLYIDRNKVRFGRQSAIISRVLWNSTSIQWSVDLSTQRIQRGESELLSVKAVTRQAMNFTHQVRFTYQSTNERPEIRSLVITNLRDLHVLFKDIKKTSVNIPLMILMFWHVLWKLISSLVYIRALTLTN